MPHADGRRGRGLSRAKAGRDRAIRPSMLAIIWHSRTGAAQAMAAAAFAGATGVAPAMLLRADEASPEVLLQAGGYLFACPENLASISGAMKEFFDRCYYPLL